MAEKTGSNICYDYLKKSFVLRGKTGGIDDSNVISNLFFLKYCLSLQSKSKALQNNVENMMFSIIVF